MVPSWCSWLALVSEEKIVQLLGQVPVTLKTVLLIPRSPKETDLSGGFCLLTLMSRVASKSASGCCSFTPASYSQVVEHGLFVKHCKVEVYLLELKLCENSDPTNVLSCHFSKADTIGEWLCWGSRCPVDRIQSVGADRREAGASSSVLVSENLRLWFPALTWEPAPQGILVKS